MAPDDRFERQVRAGWNQKRITDTAITTLGQNSLYVDLFLTFLGFDHAVYATGGAPKLEDRFMNLPLDGDKDLETIAHTMNPDSKATQLDADLAPELALYLIRNSDFVIETRQDPKARKMTLDMLVNHGIPGAFISNAGNGILVQPYHPAVMSVVDDRLKSYFLFTDGNDPHPLLNFGASAAAAGYAVKTILDLGTKSKEPFVWNLGGQDRLWLDTDHVFDLDPRDLEGLTVYQVGTGGTGSAMAYLLTEVLSPKKLYVVDPKQVKESNLNRQFPFYQRQTIGKDKATEIQRVLGPSSRTEVVPMIEEFGPDTEIPADVDLILDCSSGFDNRYYIHDAARKLELPLISVGADWKAGEATKYHPGFVSCSDCQIGHYDRAVWDALAGQRPGCDEVPQGSNIITTALMAAWGAGEIFAMARPEKYGSTPANRMVYRFLNDSQAYTEPVAGACDCLPRQLIVPSMKDVKYIDGADGALAEILVKGEPIKRM
ncbi:MAG: ThiF family adenylyltransferase [archaeon]